MTFNLTCLKKGVACLLIDATLIGASSYEVKAVESHYFKIRYRVSGSFRVDKRRTVYFKGDARIEDYAGTPYSNSRHRWQYYASGWHTGTTGAYIRCSKLLNAGKYTLIVNNIDNLSGSNYLVGSVDMAYYRKNLD